MSRTPIEDFLTRAASLRRRLDEARVALGRDSLHDLAKVRYEVETLCDLALSLGAEHRARAALALEALDADLALTTQQLEAWHGPTPAPQQGDEQP